MHSDTTSWLDGRTSERCGELIDSGHKTILGLASRFKLQTVDLLGAEPNHSNDANFFFGQYYTDAQAQADFNPVWNNVKKDVNAASYPTLYNQFTDAGYALDHMSIYDWIESRVPGGHTTPMGQLLDVAYNIEYGNVTSQQSSLNIVYLLGFSPVPGNFAVFGASNEAYRAAGFDSRKQTAIQQLGYGANAKLQLQFNSRYWNGSGPWGIGNGNSYSDTGYQNTWDVTRAQSGNTGILVDYTGGGVPLASFKGDTTDPKVVSRFAATFLKQIEPVFPGISAQWNGRATLDVPLANPYLLGSYSYWKVGQYTSFSGYEGARQPDPLTGNCHFAGEHCSTNFQGYMEGGAEQGSRAANEILKDYKAGVFP